MSQNAHTIPLESAVPEIRETPELPPRPVQVSQLAIDRGTHLTISFLALENFSNRYPGLKFNSDCIDSLRIMLSTSLESDPSLHHEIRTFVSGMPLDAIAQSAHPKRIKQLLLETILSPASLSEQLLRTDPQEGRTFGLQDIARDLQYYIRLCDFSPDPHSAREALTAVMKRAMLLEESAIGQLNSVIESFSFRFLTDKTFCLNQKRSLQASISEPVKPQVPEKPATRVVSQKPDIALKAISLFRTFEKHSIQLVAEGGETYESFQRRAHEQQRRLDTFRKECASLHSSLREDIYRHITAAWPRFSRGDSTRLKRQGVFLDFLSNLA